MTKLEEIEKAVAGLKPEELAKFRRWFEELDAELWDEQIKRDIKKGKLDNLARQALETKKSPYSGSVISISTCSKK